MTGRTAFALSAQNLQNFPGDLRIRAKHLLSVANAIRRKYCGLIAVGCCLALDGPDDLIVGSAGSTGEVEAISIPSTSPPPIARLKPLPLCLA